MLPSVFGLSGVRYYHARQPTLDTVHIYSLFFILQFLFFIFSFFWFGTSLITQPQSSGQCSISIQLNALQFNSNGLGNADPMAISRSSFFSVTLAELIHRK